MRHPGLAGVFHPGADEIGDVDGGLGLRRVGKHQHLETIAETVFRDALERRAPAYAPRKRRPGVETQRGEENGRAYAADQSQRSDHGSMPARKGADYTSRRAARRK